MAAGGSWVEQGPTTTSSRSSAPLRMAWTALRAASTTRVAVSVRGISRITCSGVLSSFSSRMRRSSVVLNMAKFLLGFEDLPAKQKAARSGGLFRLCLPLLLLDAARHSHRQRAVVAKVPKIAGGAVDHREAHSPSARPCHPL